MWAACTGLDSGEPRSLRYTPSQTISFLLQSEGAEIFYRDIAIQPITAIPSEYAAP